MASIQTTPPELLLAILSHLTESSFLPLVQTSTYLRTFIHQHASTLCNNLILSNYSHEAFVLQSTLIDGWLVPRHSIIELEEKRLLWWKNCCGRKLGEKMGVGEESELALRLSKGGPQYLQFLTEYSLEIKVYAKMFLFPSPPKDTEIIARVDEIMIITGQNQGSIPREQLNPEKFAEMIGLYAVRRFLNRLDWMVGGRGKGLGMDHNKRLTEKGLKWYHGAPRMEEGRGSLVEAVDEALGFGRSMET